MSLSSIHRAGAAALLGLASLASGCDRAEAPLFDGLSADTTPTLPCRRCEQLVDDLRRDDLAAYARHAVPPALHAQLETAWGEGRTLWPLTELPLDAKFQGFLSALAAPGSEQQLLAAFGTPVRRRATRTAHGGDHAGPVRHPVRHPGSGIQRRRARPLRADDRRARPLGAARAAGRSDPRTPGRAAAGAGRARDWTGHDPMACAGPGWTAACSGWGRSSSAWNGCCATTAWISTPRWRACAITPGRADRRPGPGAAAVHAGRRADRRRRPARAPRGPLVPERPAAPRRSRGRSRNRPPNLKLTAVSRRNFCLRRMACHPSAAGAASAAPHAYVYRGPA